ncbi:hepatocyte growth factor-regulated tyrosine kinase substrate-like [Paramacrobiotus metropolitanus]|uniref:hepatocyte growth factor-regulated tyrosine kinase substrate-like n=1 Tax=Paramacrobiotus metropolitanus TaxID=2943436 RepID=UPI0024462146|nr:hepatocyte growth factor-regulated tyrosine kinase substrate-like [Paramacrobiotus metropolitanus]
MFKNTTSFIKNVDRATSSLLLEPDWDAILAICDALRQEDVNLKIAAEAMRKKLQDKNPHSVLQCLQLYDAVVKNCGKRVHDEIITLAFMDDLVALVRKGPDDIRNRTLEVVQCWAHGFRDKPQYRVVKDTVDRLKMEGYKFPVMKESDALFVAESAPDWVDGDVCYRCRDKFSITTRKHHCRNCGQIFCSKCSSKVSPLPKYGIEKEVRVCDSCYDQLNVSKPSSTTAVTKKDADKENDLPVEYLNSALAKEPQIPAKKTAEEIQEEEELQLALAISQSEAEAKTKHSQPNSWSSSVLNAQKTPSEKTVENGTSLGDKVANMTLNNSTNSSSNELDKYLNRQYWEDRQKDAPVSGPVFVPNAPSAPTPSSTPSTVTSGDMSHQKFSYQNGETDDEIQQFMSALKSQISVFTNRMKSNISRKRPLGNDATVISMFNNLLPMRQQLLEYSQAQDHWKEYYERLQEKLTRLKEAREALDVLRQEHRDKIRLEAEEKHRLMQMQMIAKLDNLRVHKRQLLEYQRQIAFQQMQAQEEELQRRKQVYQPYSYVPGGGSTSYAASLPGDQRLPQNQQPAVFGGPVSIAPPGYAMQAGYNHNEQMYQPVPQHPQNVYGMQPSVQPGISAGGPPLSAANYPSSVMPSAMYPTGPQNQMNYPQPNSQYGTYPMPQPSMTLPGMPMMQQYHNPVPQSGYQTAHTPAVQMGYQNQAQVDNVHPQLHHQQPHVPNAPTSGGLDEAPLISFD